MVLENLRNISRIGTVHAFSNLMKFDDHSKKREQTSILRNAVDAILHNVATQTKRLTTIGKVEGLSKPEARYGAAQPGQASPSLTRFCDRLGDTRGGF